MNRLVLGLSVLLFFGLSTNAQNKETSGDDASAVRSTITNYIEAYYTGNAARMKQTLHPHYLKHKIHGNIPVREQTGADLVQAARSGEGTHLTQAQRDYFGSHTYQRNDKGADAPFVHTDWIRK